MLKQFIKKVLDSKLFSPSPAHHHLRALRTTQVERRAIPSPRSAPAPRRCT
jgi:hypothetical protein